MIDSSALLAALKAQLRTLQADLKERADDPTTTWGAALQREHSEALRRERTGLPWTAWRDNEVDQAAVAWIVATTFVRFCEDNDLLVGATLDGMPVPVGWIAGPGDRSLYARENQTAYFRINTSHHDRDWLQQSFRVLAAQPAGAALIDPRHNPVWTAEISAEAAKGLVNFWRRTEVDGTLVHDFTDPDLKTRFLGDLYQDLSEHAKKTYALLQTPVFVEEFILDRTLTPAIHEFGIDGLKIIDPTCGSGHFLLGAFKRLNQQLASEAPGMDPKQRVRKAMNSIHGVDLNPFAVAIARFRLTVAGILAAGEKSLAGVPELGFHLAIGDSLLSEQGVTNALFGDDTYSYSTEDVGEYTEILRPGRYHVVVGNPPYIQPKDPALKEAYRRAYSTAHREFQLSVPFMELFFRLAIRGEVGQGAGLVGQITSNGFMRQEFGKKLIEDFFANFHVGNPVDLLLVADTAGAYIPGHGTPTVIIVGRRRRPVSGQVRAVLGVRGEPGTPVDASTGLVWTEIVEHVDNPGYDGAFVSVRDLDREVLSHYPWPIANPTATALRELIESAADSQLCHMANTFGYTGQTNADGAFLAPRPSLERRRVEEDVIREFVTGDDVRDFRIGSGLAAIFPYREGKLAKIDEMPGVKRWLWPVRSATWSRATFSKQTYKQEGRTWWEWHQVALDRVGRWAITFPSVATSVHFSLDREGKVFNRHAAFIQLPQGSSEDCHLGLLGLLNSSTASFWLKQVSHNKGSTRDASGARQTLAPWEDFYAFTGTKLQDFPLPAQLPELRGGILDELVRDLESLTPYAVVADWGVGRVGGGLADALVRAHDQWSKLRRRLVFEQEELDWETYALFGLVAESMTYDGSSVEGIFPGQRAFEIALARRVEGGEEESAWFERHGSIPILEVPAEWPTDYRGLVEKRLALIESDRDICMLERPEHKRRWANIPWNEQLQEALKAAILERLETAELWRDFQGPITRSVAQLADLVRNDEVLLELARELTGTPEPDLVAVIGSLAPTEAVPFLAMYRYNSSGLEKFGEWQAIWELQRREDSGEKVTIPMPPKFGDKDFRRSEYWKARGKLDVPKERFVLYPGFGRGGDITPVLGWAGWSQRDQAVALVREIMNQQALGVPNDALVPMVAGLVELEPWLHQWHTELESDFGSSAAQAVTSQIEQFLAHLRMTRDDVNAWRPPAVARGRRRSA
jgi:hypothetical protein